ncbi:diaminopimelate epimerase [Bizionia sediminis]|uniref:Diaminopimelate epimerase n=1 Tax=Bizionia sediminis TaxID=1737064 RepID=A0ABW5KUM7_9FLAO
MTNSFYKYQGTGNDFVIIDNRTNSFGKNNTKLIKSLCDRRFGIGADGLILLENHPEYDFNMVYYNANGYESTMCGNGGRCAVAFANFLGVIKNKATFLAVDGVHKAHIEGTHVKLQMQDVTAVTIQDNFVFLDTGSPHHVQMVSNLEDLDVVSKGAAIRYGAPYNETGTNVNFVKKITDTRFAVRTYERGVENETLSCGTGVTAVALAMHAIKETNNTIITLETQGGRLEVSFTKTALGYQNIWLTGPATQVFKGNITW